MRLTLLVAAVAAIVTTPAMAADAAPARAGQMLRDSRSARVGLVDRVNPDGSVRIILDSRFVTIPASTLTSTDGKLATSLSKSEIAKLK
jgi:hypothetical protein